MKKFRLVGYWDGHQHAKVDVGYFGLIKVLKMVKSGKSIKIERLGDDWRIY